MVETVSGQERNIKKND